MKKAIVLSIMAALILLAGSAYSQASAKDDTPTFYRLVPGTYVNGWPRFTIHYPKEWVERRPEPQERFHVSVPEPGAYPAVGVAVMPYPVPLEKLAENLVALNRGRATDVTVISDKPALLKDGTPAREIEMQMLLSGSRYYTMHLATRKSGQVINTVVQSRKERIGEDLKAIVYSIEFQPGKDEPVTVRPDIQEFLDSWRNAVVSHDVARVMTHYSDKFLNSGLKKRGIEEFWRRAITPITSFEVGITEFVAGGDKAHVAGFVSDWFGKDMLQGTLIKENGEWKWYGNQRNPAP